MLNVNFFLGFPMREDFAKAVAKLDPKFIQLFVGENDEYLKQATYKDVIYWGKNVGEIGDVDKLELLESNIYSILKKIVPDYPYQEIPLLLFPLVSDRP